MYDSDKEDDDGLGQYLPDVQGHVTTVVTSTLYHVTSHSLLHRASRLVLTQA
jgi:hypothetical protein